MAGQKSPAFYFFSIGQLGKGNFIKTILKEGGKYEWEY